ncbi:MAG: PP2C family protein-serine/threonine phosphatase [Candidatus Velthaea sp.]
MSAVHIPVDDAARLDAVRRFAILDTPPDGAFDRIAALAARLLDVPIALVTIVDEDRIWFKSRIGLDDVTEIPRDPGLCASAICQNDVYVVENARADVRTLANPLVAGEFGLQFYAAAPLRTHDGANLGTLCVLDREPRTLSPSDAQTLETLAAVVVDELELRLRALEMVTTERRLTRKSAELAAETARLYEREHRVAKRLQEASLPRTLPRMDGIAFDAVYQPGQSDAEIGGDWYDAFALPDGRVVLSIGDVLGSGLDAAVLMGRVRQGLRLAAVINPDPAAVLRAVDDTLVLESFEGMATALVAILDPVTLTMACATAGHPRPLLCAPDGTVTEPFTLAAPPLGLHALSDVVVETAVLPRGSLLVLYTDGLTESTRSLDEGERRVRAALAQAAVRQAERPAAAIRDAVLFDGSRDDVAILTLSIAGGAA